MGLGNVKNKKGKSQGELMEKKVICKSHAGRLEGKGGICGGRKGTWGGSVHGTEGRKTQPESDLNYPRDFSAKKNIWVSSQQGKKGIRKRQELETKTKRKC